jgi:hypothetical protein
MLRHLGVLASVRYSSCLKRSKVAHPIYPNSNTLSLPCSVLTQIEIEGTTRALFTRRNDHFPSMYVFQALHVRLCPLFRTLEREKSLRRRLRACLPAPAAKTWTAADDLITTGGASAQHFDSDSMRYVVCKTLSVLRVFAPLSRSRP